ncbi:uncharacterized protein [Venturia canescens]|uniref:uncharacterized protein isoform X1 n=1 Tax=Venturia canescens TaxID=32260 RepID=UPI001C9C2D28|nr:uncharacterized protein LOC122412630 isoform X1 [Venturia canescens]
MEFEIACVYRMFRVLLDLMSALEVALENESAVRTADDRNSHQKGFNSIADLKKHLISFSDIVNIRMKTKPYEKRQSQKRLQSSMANLKEAQSEMEAIKSALGEARSEHERTAGLILAEIEVENSNLEKIRAHHAAELI